MFSLSDAMIVFSLIVDFMIVKWLVFLNFVQVILDFKIKV